jgi:hypothetical protein
MLHKAAEVVNKLGVEHALLHGGIPGKDRRGLIERFRNDPKCRVFLSTDAGGTGLNLQTADTLINLEMPWNPAVLEQRIARVHRMGQHRPVQVFNLVMRDSIEERVLKTLEQKRSLFEGLFEGTSDEVVFGELGQQAFLDTIKQLVGPAVPAEPAVLEGVPAPAAAGSGAGSPETALLQVGVQFLEALAAAFTTPGGAVLTTDPRTGQTVLQIPVPSPQLLQRGAAALQTIVQHVNGPAKPS